MLLNMLSSLCGIHLQSTTTCRVELLNVQVNYFTLFQRILWVTIIFLNFLGISSTGPPIPTVFNGVKLVASSVIGIVYDCLMMKFLKNRIEPAAPSQSPGFDQLVPWKSAPKEEKSLTVPLSATLVNTVCIIFGKLYWIYTNQSCFKWIKSPCTHFL